MLGLEVFVVSPGDEFAMDSKMAASNATWRTLSACCAGILAGIPTASGRACAATRYVATNGDTARKNACATSVGRLVHESGKKA